MNRTVYAHDPKWKKLLIHWNENQKKTTSIGFQFHRPKLSGDGCFTHFVSYGELYKEIETGNRYHPTQSTFKENYGNSKNINSQFHYRKFSKQRNSVLSYYYRRVTRGRKGRGLSCIFLKIGRKCSGFGKKCPDFGHLWV